MARVDAPITYTKWADANGMPTQYFYQLILDLWRKTGGSSDIDIVSIVQNISQVSPRQSSGKESRVFQTEVSSNYTITGDFTHEIVICTNTSAITITMPLHYEEAQATVIRGGTGGVTIDGNGTNIVGEATQAIPLQYDAAHMFGTSTEWALR